MDGMNSIEWVWDVIKHSSNGQEFSIIRHGETSSTSVIMKMAIPPDPPSRYCLKIIGGGGQSIHDNGKHILVISSSL
jgi:hypothetical protein